ncbi:MAG: DUF3089 domain-containing protein, partial [Hyphomonadaceae bacterium]
MKYVAGALLVGVFAWFGLKNPAYNTLMQRGDLDIPSQLDYTPQESWAIIPDEQPAGAWETPWGVDIFLVFPSPRNDTKHGLMLPNDAFAHSSQLALSEEIQTALPEGTSLYAPKYRSLSNTASKSTKDMQVLASGDLEAAFQSYLEVDNRGRAVMLVSIGDTAPLISPILERLQLEDLQHRFAGLVHFTPDAAQDASHFDALTCSPGLEGACFQSVPIQEERPLTDQILARLPNTRAHYKILDA